MPFLFMISHAYLWICVAAFISMSELSAPAVTETSLFFNLKTKNIYRPGCSLNNSSLAPETSNGI